MNPNNNALSEEEYCNVLFQQFYYTSLLYKKTPFMANTFKPDQSRTTFLLYLSSPRGWQSTKQLIVRNSDCEKLKQLLLDAYPSLTISEVNAH